MVWAATGIAAASAIYGGVSANNAAKAQAGQSRVAGFGAQQEGALNQQMAELEASDIERAAMLEADNIKRAALVMRGTIAVAQSGSGVMIGEGSAQAAIDQLDTLSSADALAALYSGVNKSASARASGRFNMAAGNERGSAMSAQSNSLLAAGKASLVGGLLNAGVAAGSGYLKANPPKGK